MSAGEIQSGKGYDARTTLPASEARLTPPPGRPPGLEIPTLPLYGRLGAVLAADSVIGGRLDRLLGGLYVDLGKGDHRGSVFLAGTGRSGTTWLSDVVNHRGGYRYVFEPFHPGKVEAFAHFRPRQYLRPDDRREEFLGPARRVLTGGSGTPGSTGSIGGSCRGGA
jgi:hypothetical protein